MKSKIINHILTYIYRYTLKVSLHNIDYITMRTNVSEMRQDHGQGRAADKERAGTGCPLLGLRRMATAGVLLFSTVLGEILSGYVIKA